MSSWRHLNRDSDQHHSGGMQGGRLRRATLYPTRVSCSYYAPHPWQSEFFRPQLPRPPSGFSIGSGACVDRYGKECPGYGNNFLPQQRGPERTGRRGKFQSSNRSSALEHERASHKVRTDTLSAKEQDADDVCASSLSSRKSLSRPFQKSSDTKPGALAPPEHGVAAQGSESPRWTAARAEDRQLTTTVAIDTQSKRAMATWPQLMRASAEVTHFTNPAAADKQLTGSSAEFSYLKASEARGPDDSSHKRKKRKHDKCIRKSEGDESDLNKIYWKKHCTEQMRQDIVKRFPDLLRKTYFIPPDLFYKLEYAKSGERQSLPSDVLVLDKSSLPNLSCNRSELLARLCLTSIAASVRSPMVLLFNYHFDNYLNKNLHEIPLPQARVKDVPESPMESHLSFSQTPDEASANAKPSAGGTFDPPSQCPFKTARKIFPSPENCPAPPSKPSTNARQNSNCCQVVRGDFDVLVVSKEHGFIVMEVKSIGDHAAIPDKAEQVTEVSDDSIRKRIRDVVQGQMQKSETVLRHLLSDLYERVEDVRVIKVMAVPNLKRSRLRNAVESDLDLTKHFSSCFIGRPEGSLEEALEQCLCEEDVGSTRNLCERAAVRLDERPEKDDVLKSWWENLTKRKDPNEHGFQSKADPCVVSDDVYIQIVSRFCGMYSTVEVDNRKGHRDEVRTLDECIHLTGVRFGRNILFPAQKSILDKDDRFLCLTGAPGSGKTLILGLKAVEWAKNGHVIIISIKGVEYGSLVSLTLKRQVVQMVQGCPEKVHAERVCLETNVENFVDVLLRKYEGMRLGLIIDEIPKEVSKYKQHEKLQQSVESLQTALDVLRDLLCKSLDVPPESHAPHDNPPQTLKEIEECVDFLEERIKRFHVAGTEDFLPILDEEWTKPLKEIQILGKEGRAVLESLTKSWQHVNGVEERLQEICFHMHSALGSLYNLYSSLYFLIIHKLMEVLAKRHEEDNPDVRVWTSCLFPFKLPKLYEQATLDLCVRCPPAVQTLLELLDTDVHEEAQSMFTYLNILSVHNPPLPSTGHQIKLLDHSNHVTQVTEVSDCAECGKALLTYLVDTLRVSTSSKGPLQPHDVIISGSPFYGNKDCAFLQELKKSFDLKLESNRLEGAPPYTDNIFVTGGSVLQGLESKIVVNVPKVKFILAREGEGVKDHDQRADLPDWLEDLGTWNRRQLWFVASRSLSHLIVFVCARPRQ